MNFNDKDISYLIVSSNDMVSILWAKDYKVIPIKSYYKGIFEDSAIAFGGDNDSIRADMLFLLNHLNEDNGIVKYRGETNVKKVFSNGSEIPMGIDLYNSDENIKSYLFEGLSLSFVEQNRYWKPKKIEDFKVGMVVEYFNKNKWLSQKVENPLDEYNNLYKLLIKYDKIRVPFI